MAVRQEPPAGASSRQHNEISGRSPRFWKRRLDLSCPGYEAIVPPDFNYDIAARIGLLFWTYLPGLRLRRFSRPILILPSKIDKINPPGPTMRRARNCGAATIVELECEHMEIALEPNRSQIVDATLAFSRRVDLSSAHRA